jgi:hypothetical protein
MAAGVEELTIDSEFASVLPDLTPVQLAQLEANLSTEGWRKEQAIIVWANHNNTIVDGMNRYRLCRHLEIPFRIVAKTFEDREAVKEWILTNAYGQRNMTPEQEAYCRGEVYELRKKREGAPEGNINAKQLGQNDPVVSSRTSEQVASQFGVSERTIRRDGRFADAVNTLAKNVSPEVKQDILSGRIKATKSEVIKASQEPPAQQRRAVESLARKPEGEPKPAGKAKAKKRQDKLVAAAITAINRIEAAIEKRGKATPVCRQEALDRLKTAKLLVSKSSSLL